jgi:hypothetical protein
MKKLRDENGQALIISALCMTCLIGFVALAADVGIMLREKRLLQTAADSAAIAGALEINYNPSGVTAAALAAAGQNGFAAATSGTTTAGGVTVTVNPPPLYGPHAGQAGYVEVIVSQIQPTLFMRVFGILNATPIANMTPTARAVAQNGGSSTGCVYILAPTGTGMSLQGNFNLTAPNCGLIIDSSDPSAALNFTGKAGDINAGSVGVVGGVSGSSSGTQPVTPIVPISDPLSFLIAQMPDPTVNPLKASCTVPNAGGKKGAGVLTGAVTASGGVVCYSGDVTISSATFGPGTYVFTGNVTLDTSVITTGATLDINSGTLTENTGTTLSLSPPPLGSTFGGISIMAPPTNAGPLNFAIGNATGTINGDIYAPGATMTMQDNGGGGSGCSKGGLVLNTDLIVKVLDDTSSCITINSFSESTGASQLTRVTLVE